MITAVVVERHSQAEVARAHGVSQPWISRLVARYRRDGEARDLAEVQQSLLHDEISSSSSTRTRRG